MATNFPTSLDTLTNPTSSDSLASPSHASQHANVNDAVEALQAKVGVDGSTVATSMDRKLPRGLMAETSTTTSYSTTNSYADVLSCPSFIAVANRLYKVTFACGNAGNLAAGSRIAVKLLYGTTDITIGYHATVVGGTVLHLSALLTATGSIVVKAQARYDIGSSSGLYAGSESPMRLWVEDVGPY